VKKSSRWLDVCSLCTIGSSWSLSCLVWSPLSLPIPSQEDWQKRHTSTKPARNFVIADACILARICVHYTRRTSSFDVTYGCWLVKLRLLAMILVFSCRCITNSINRVVGVAHLQLRLKKWVDSTRMDPVDLPKNLVRVRLGLRRRKICRRLSQHPEPYEAVF
jgi:hypothetical protein